MHWLVRYFRRNFHQVRPSVNQGRLPYCVNVGVYLLMNDKGEAPLFAIPATPMEENTVSERRLHILSMRLILRACGSGGKKRYVCMYVCMYVCKRWA